ncbi:MAG: DUF429 domain-containing protein [Steroidobacter sp.]
MTLVKRLMAGVDGCRDGWLAVIQGGREVDALIAPDLKALLGAIPGALIAIDIPIGLPDRGSRDCDLQAPQRFHLYEVARSAMEN